VRAPATRHIPLTYQRRNSSATAKTYLHFLPVAARARYECDVSGLATDAFSRQSAVQSCQCLERPWTQSLERHTATSFTRRSLLPPVSTGMTRHFAPPPDICPGHLLYINLYSPKKGSTQKHSSGSINTNKAKTASWSIAVGLVDTWDWSINKISYIFIFIYQTGDNINNDNNRKLNNCKHLTKYYSLF